MAFEMVVVHLNAVMILYSEQRYYLRESDWFASLIRGVVNAMAIDLVFRNRTPPFNAIEYIYKYVFLLSSVVIVYALQ